MNIYLITQDVNNGYDTYDGKVVCADNEDEAIEITKPEPENDINYWASKKDLKVKLIGKADETIKKGIILASFHAG